MIPEATSLYAIGSPTKLFTNIYLGGGTAAAPSFTVAGYTTTGIFGPVANALGFSISGTEKHRFHASGGVSFGDTTDPGAGVTRFATAIALGASPVAAGDIRGPAAADITVNTGTNRDLIFQNNGTRFARINPGGGPHLVIGVGNIPAPNRSGISFAASSFEIKARNNADTSDTTIMDWSVGAADLLRIPTDTSFPSGVVTIGTNASGVGTLRLPTGNAGRISFRNAANTGEGSSLESGVADQLVVRNNGALALTVDTTGIALGVNSAGGGALRMANSTYIKQRNAANTGDVNIAVVGGANEIHIGDTGQALWFDASAGNIDFRYAVTALGGGAAPTLGTIGGSGPATAAQNSWLKILINGTASYIPIWR